MNRFIFTFCLSIFIAFFSFIGCSFAKTYATARDEILDNGEPWIKVNTDKQIFDLSYKYLVKEFGEKWAAYYTPTEIQKDNLFKCLSAKYSFSGPANLKLERASIDFIFEIDPKDNLEKIKFWRGAYFVPPYDTSKLITIQEATKIANQKGFKVEFRPLEATIGSKKYDGKYFLCGFEYFSSVGNEIVREDAEDGSINSMPAAIPVGPEPVHYDATPTLPNDPYVNSLDMSVLFKPGVSNQEIIDTISAVGVILRQDPDGAVWIDFLKGVSKKDALLKMKSNKAVKQVQPFSGYAHTDLLVTFYEGISYEEKKRIISSVGVIADLAPDNKDAWVNVTNGMSCEAAIKILQGYKEIMLAQRHEPAFLE